MQVDRQEIEQLLTDLMSQESVVNTDGEKQMAKNIYHYIASFPYFQQHQGHVELTSTHLDDKERFNVVAYIKGEDAVPTSETVVLMGHLDTVGVADFGQIKHAATHSEVVKEHYRTAYKVPPIVRKHAGSADWIFGRGSVDMKSGLASHLYVLRHFALHPQELSGNLVIVITCDEEDSSRGMRSVLKDLKRLKERENLVYIAAINADYTSSRHAGDDNRYVYVGTVGKLLPTFFITGKETHVGQVFEGFDPNLLISTLTEEVDYNPLLCDEKYGEWTLPPVSLKQSDLKPFYDVQTPLSAFVYYNFFVHSWSPKKVLQKLKMHGRRAFERAIRIYEDRREMFSKLSGVSQEAIHVSPRVYTFEEYYEHLKRCHGQRFEKEVGKYCQKLLQEEQLDVRQYACRVVEHVWDEWDVDKEPLMIIFYSNIYNPRVAVSEESAEGSRLMAAIQEAVEQVQPFYEKNIVVKQFYPYISDMSYVALSDDEESMETLENNMPTWGEAYRLNVEDIRALNIPVCNIGPYGFDAHKKFERVEATYSLEMVPFLTYSVIRRLLKR